MEIKSKFFNEDSENFPWDKQALEAFKKLINGNGIKCRMDDIFLLAFLRARNFDQRKSLQLLQNYYNCRCQNPTYSKDLLPSKLAKILSLNIMQFVPIPDQKGRYVFIVQLGNFDINVVTVTEYLRVVMLFLDFQLNFHRAQVKETVVIVNSAGLTLRHLIQFTPGFFISMVAILFSDSYPMRFQEIHYTSVNVFMKALLSVLLPLFPLKVKNMVHLHTDMSTLHKFIHPQYLPMEYGGELPSFDPSEMNEMIIENEEFFRMNESYLKIYEEGNNKRISEDISKHLNEEDENNQLKESLKFSEENFKHIKENPERYFSNMDSDFSIRNYY